VKKSDIRQIATICLEKEIIMAEDRRIKKTKKALYSALINLLSEKDLRMITIQELCDLADVHRATFYYHYSDIYALYDELEGQSIDALTSALVTDETHKYSAIYTSFIKYIHDNAKVWTVLLSGRGNSDFHDRIAKIFENKIIEICEFETGKSDFSDEYRLLISFETNGFLAMIIRWLDDGMTLSEDVLASLLQNTDDAIDFLMDKYL
jgi:AcrR family transcriptional regulator